MDTTGTPEIISRGRSVIIRYREYLGEVIVHPTTVGEFYSNTYNVNPANVVTFPWLAPIAQQFDQYKPRGIIFQFKSTSSDTSTNANVGSVMMATEYDVLDPAYDSKQEMMNSAFASETRSSMSMLHGLECDPNELQRKIFYTRRVGSIQEPNSDLRDYDLCRTTVATQGSGFAPGQSVGSLYVHYEFELFKEHVWGGVASRNQIWAIYQQTSVTTANWSQVVGGGGATPIEPPTAAGLSLGIQLSTNTIHIPRKWQGGTFQFTWYLEPAAAYTSVIPGVVVATGCTNVVSPFNTPHGPYVLLGPYSSESAQNRTATLILKVDDVLTTEYAEFTVSDSGFMPAVAALFVNASLEVRLIPQEYYSLG